MANLSVYLKLFALIACIFTLGCDDYSQGRTTGTGNNTQYVNTGFEPEQMAPTENISDPLTEEDLNILLTNPYSNELGYTNSKYAFFRGVAASQNIYLIGNVKIIGALYASQDIYMGAGAVFTGDLNYLFTNMEVLSFKDDKIIFREKDLSSASNLSDYGISPVDSARNRQPMDLTGLPHRYTVLQYRTESEKSFENWVNEYVKN